MPGRLCVGIVIGAHGVRGQVRIKSFTADPADLTAYGPVETEDRQVWRLQGVTVGMNGVVTARIDGVADRTGAEALKGAKLYVRQDALPPPAEEEFYIADLVGLAAIGLDGHSVGTVSAVFNFGAGDLLAVKTPDGEVLLPFTKRSVPVVDVAGRRVVIDPPVLTADEDEDEDRDAEGE